MTEGREELNEEFYETLQKILGKVNKKDYIMLIGDMNDRVGNNKVANIVGTNGEDTLNSNGRKLIDFCTFNNPKLINTFLLLLLVFSPWAGLGRGQSSVRRLVWLWYAASWASS